MMPMVSTSPLRNKSDNFTGGDLPFVVPSSDLQNAVFSLMAIVIFIGTTGNVLSLSVILYRRLRLRPFNIIVTFLVVEDLITCCIVAPLLLTNALLYVQDNAVNTTVCRISFSLTLLSKIGSLMTMGEIAILRVINLSNSVCARKLLSKTSMAIIITFNIVVLHAWIISTFFDIGICDAMESQSIEPKIGAAVMLCSFITVIVSCYTGIACYTKTRVGQLAVQRNERGVRYDIATIRTCIVISVAFFVFHLPFIIYVVLLNKDVLSINVVEFTFYFQLHLFSQAGNPIIMFCTCREFRKHVLMFVRRRCKRNRIGEPAVVALDLPGANLRP